MIEIDEDALRLMRRYCGGDPREPREIAVAAFEEFGGEEWMLEAFLAKINEAVASIPADRRASAKVELSGGYDESTSLKIMYSRLETPEEVAENVKRALAYVRRERDQERRQYEALRRKFEPSDLRTDLRKAMEITERIATEDGEPAPIWAQPTAEGTE